jgi:hypothetical protein
MRTALPDGKYKASTLEDKQRQNVMTAPPAAEMESLSLVSIQGLHFSRPGQNAKTSDEKIKLDVVCLPATMIYSSQLFIEVTVVAKSRASASCQSA